MIIATTARLLLRRLTVDDAGFILELVNEPAWLLHIGDKQVHDLRQARSYLMSGPIASYEQFGFGLYLVEIRATGQPAGICGLIKRETLSDVDLGFAIAEKHRGNGYATDAARASLEHGQRDLGLDRIVAITSPENAASAHVLEKIGCRFEKQLDLDDGRGPVQLFVWDRRERFP